MIITDEMETLGLLEALWAAEDALAARIANIEAEQAQSEEDKTPILTELFRLQTAP